MTDQEMQAALASLQKTILETQEALRFANVRIAILQTENEMLRLALSVAMPLQRKGARA